MPFARALCVIALFCVPARRGPAGVETASGRARRGPGTAEQGQLRRSPFEVSVASRGRNGPRVRGNRRVTMLAGRRRVRKVRGDPDGHARGRSWPRGPACRTIGFTIRPRPMGRGQGRRDGGPETAGRSLPRPVHAGPDCKRFRRSRSRGRGHAMVREDVHAAK